MLHDLVRRLALTMLTAALATPASASAASAGAADSSASAADGVTPAPAGAKSSPAATSELVVVAKLVGLGVDPEVMKRLEDYLRGEISRIPGFAIVSRAEQEQVLNHPKHRELADTRGDPERMRRLAQAFKARYAVQGTVASLGGTIQFNVKVLDTRTASRKPSKIPRKGLREESGTLTGSGEQLIPGVRLIAYRLFAPALITGYLQLEVPLTGVSILVDGSSAGLTPLRSPLALAPGQHDITLRRAGFEELSLQIVIHPFQVTVVNTTLTQP